MRLAAFITLLACFSACGQEALVEGNPNSTVRVVVYEDLQCPDCATYRKMMDEQLLPKFGSVAAFEHRDFPLEKHKWARKAAIAARFFQSSNPAAALEFRRLVMSHQAEIDPDNFNRHLSEFAKKHGIDPAKVLAALDDAKYAKPVEDDYQEGVARGVSKTPTVFVNGEPFIERFEFDELVKSIDAALGTVKR